MRKLRRTFSLDKLGTVLNLARLQSTLRVIPPYLLLPEHLSHQIPQLEHPSHQIPQLEQSSLVLQLQHQRLSKLSHTKRARRQASENKLSASIHSQLDDL
jgi:hypothetical protein